MFGPCSSGKSLLISSLNLPLLRLPSLAYPTLRPLLADISASLTTTSSSLLELSFASSASSQARKQLVKQVHSIGYKAWAIEIDLDNKMCEHWAKVKRVIEGA